METLQQIDLIFNIPFWIFKFFFNLTIWYVFLFGTYKLFERFWDGWR